MRRAVGRVPLALALLLLTGCAMSFREVGVAVPETEGFEVGRTTKAEVLRAIGPPRIVLRQFDGDLYTWRRTKRSRRSLTLMPVYVQAFYYSDTRLRRDDLSMLFDAEGILRGIGLRRETEE